MKNILTILAIGILFFSSCKQGIDSQAFEKLNKFNKKEVVGKVGSETYLNKKFGPSKNI